MIGRVHGGRALQGRPIFCFNLVKQPREERMRRRRWSGPYTIHDLLTRFVHDSRGRPPEEQGVYLVSRKTWKGIPDDRCVPLYAGSTTGGSPRFRTRIGDLLADIFGFYGEATGHHSGGQSLHKWCKRNKVDPGKLYIGWVTTTCVRCEENDVFDRLDPLLNRNRPSRCKGH